MPSRSSFGSGGAPPAAPEIGRRIVTSAFVPSRSSARNSASTSPPPSSRRSGRGNRASETHPYYSGATPHTTTFRYDGLDRLIRQTNPDATTKTFVHDIDRR